MRLSHVAIAVADPERSAAFYGEYFGLDRRVNEDEHLVILASSDGSLLALNPGTPGGDSGGSFTTEAVVRRSRPLAWPPRLRATVLVRPRSGAHLFPGVP